MRRLRAWIAQHRLLASLSVVLLVGLLGAGTLIGLRLSRPEPVPLERLFKDYQARLLDLPGVVSVGIGERYGKRYIEVWVRQLTPEITRRVPDELGSWQVRVQELPRQSPSPQSPTPTPLPSELPDPESLVVDIRGVVSGITRIEDPDAEVLGWMLVRGHREPRTVTDRASVAVTPDTAFYHLEAEGLRPAQVPFTSAELLGRGVEIRFDGDVAGIDPVQATAAVVVFLSPET